MSQTTSQFFQERTGRLSLAKKLISLENDKSQYDFAKGKASMLEKRLEGLEEEIKTNEQNFLIK